VEGRGGKGKGRAEGKKKGKGRDRPPFANSWIRPRRMQNTHKTQNYKVNKKLNQNMKKYELV